MVRNRRFLSCTFCIYCVFFILPSWVTLVLYGCMGTVDAHDDNVTYILNQRFQTEFAGEVIFKQSSMMGISKCLRYSDSC